MLLYQGTAVVMQEVPDEISLAFNISGCPHHCEGCHSPELWENDGAPLLENLPTLLDKYQGLVTCILFMGGDWDENELMKAAKMAQEHGYKTALYTGLDNMFDLSMDTISVLDYIKFGRYIKDRGPITEPTSNQQMFKIEHEEDKPYNITGKNITYKFRKQEGDKDGQTKKGKTG